MERLREEGDAGFQQNIGSRPLETLTPSTTRVRESVDVQLHSSHLQIQTLDDRQRQTRTSNLTLKCVASLFDYAWPGQKTEYKISNNLPADILIALFNKSAHTYVNTSSYIYVHTYTIANTLRKTAHHLLSLIVNCSRVIEDKRIRELLRKPPLSLHTYVYIYVCVCENKSLGLSGKAVRS